MRKISADWIVTLNGFPLKNGVIVVDDEGRIKEVLSSSNGDDVEQYQGIICPGFINAHCHLELSHLKDKLPQKTGLVEFIQNVQKFRNVSEDEIAEAIELAEQEMITNGIVGVGDISNSAYSFEQKWKTNISYHTFIEVFGFNPSNADQILKKAQELKSQTPQTASITPHAPYSVSKELFELVKNLETEGNLLSIHNQESREEAKFYESKSGDFLKLYESFGLDISYFKPSGKNSIQSYLGWMNPAKKLLVHNTFSDAADIDFAEGIGRNYWCLCPNANLYIENALPDVPLLVDKNVKLVLGTDSVASNNQLSILAEMQTIAQYFPFIDFELMLSWACKNGADFFNWNKLGSIEQGKTPGLNLIQFFDYDSEEGKFYLTSNSTVTKIA